MNTARTQIKPRRGVTSLLGRTRALAKARGINAINLSKVSGVSPAVAQRVINNQLNNIAKKTETRLRIWLEFVEAKPVLTMLPDKPIHLSPPPEFATDRQGEMFQTTTNVRLEQEIKRKDARIKLYEDELENKAGMIRELQDTGTQRTATIKHLHHVIEEAEARMVETPVVAGMIRELQDTGTLRTEVSPRSIKAEPREDVTLDREVATKDLHIQTLRKLNKGLQDKVHDLKRIQKKLIKLL